MKKFFAVVAVACSLASFAPAMESAQAATTVTTTRTVTHHRPMRPAFGRPHRCRSVTTTRRFHGRMVRTTRRICR